MNGNILRTIIVVCIVLSTLHVTLSKVFTLEVEKFAPASMRMPRSGASENFTVLMKNGDFIHIEICLRDATFVRIENIVFSNDGDADSISATIDERNMGTFQSTSTHGNLGNDWNSFMSSGPLQGKAMLDLGRHVITLRSATDEWGIEIDNIVLAVGDELIKHEDLLCNLYCSDIKYDSVPRTDSIPSGKFVQKSMATLCSEQDNVKVQLFHDTATNFDITAALPKYTSFANNKKPIYDNCVLSKPYWIFVNKTVNPMQDAVKSDGATLAFSGSFHRTVVTVKFSFKKITPTRELDERLVNSVLYVKLRNMHRENVHITPEYKKGNVWIRLQDIELTPFANEYTWDFKDRTWDIIQDNAVRLFIKPGHQQVIVDTVKLESRSPPDTTVDLYADSNMVYQAVRLGFWQHWADDPNSMTLVVIKGKMEEHHKIDSLRIYAKVPWTGGYSQVFVLYQDGRVRLQAMTPHGLDYVPFGSSVYIGQPESVNSMRPYAPIQKITISTVTSSLNVEYKDGNRASLTLETMVNETKLKVRECVFKRNRNVYPLMTFKSMWVSDGNAHADHVTINGDISRHVMADWKELFGITAVFFKKCISVHNTQAPDMTIKILSNSDT